MSGSSLRLLAGLAAVLLPVPGGPVRADMMTACEPEVAALCADVHRGRGRITACLAAHVNALSPGCLSEVKAAVRRPGVPATARKLLEPGLSAALPESCAGAVKRVCPGVPEGDARAFGCLYAHSDSVSQLCLSEARKALRQAP